MSKNLEEYTLEEVSKHDYKEDCWIILGNEIIGYKVYDLTSYLQDHPGGSEVILEFAGKNADGIFEDIGHSTFARSLLHRYEIGRLKPTEK